MEQDEILDGCIDQCHEKLEYVTDLLKKCTEKTPDLYQLARDSPHFCATLKAAVSVFLETTINRFVSSMCTHRYRYKPTPVTVFEFRPIRGTITHNHHHYFLCGVKLTTLIFGPDGITAPDFYKPYNLQTPMDMLKEILEPYNFKPVISISYGQDLSSMCTEEWNSKVDIKPFRFVNFTISIVPIETVDCV